MLKRPSKNISLYLNYPTEERLNILRERVKSWNVLDKLKEQRLSKIANQKEIVAYLMGDAETIAIVDSRQKEIDRRKAKEQKMVDIAKKISKPLADVLSDAYFDMATYGVAEIKPEPKPTTESKRRDWYMPAFVQDVLGGGAYPEQYECSAEEQKILYNQRFLELFQQYRTAKSPTTADIIMSQIVDLVRGLE